MRPFLGSSDPIARRSVETSWILTDKGLDAPNSSVEKTIPFHSGWIHGPSILSFVFAKGMCKRTIGKGSVWCFFPCRDLKDDTFHYVSCRRACLSLAPRSNGVLKCESKSSHATPKASLSIHHTPFLSHPRSWKLHVILSRPRSWGLRCEPSWARCAHAQAFKEMPHRAKLERTPGRDELGWPTHSLHEGARGDTPRCMVALGATRTTESTVDRHGEANHCVGESGGVVRVKVRNSRAEGTK